MNSGPSTDRRRLLVVWLYVLAAAWGVESVRMGDGFSRLGLGLCFLMASFAAAWAVADAKSLGRPLLHIVAMLVFLLWMIALPVYLVWSRGWRGLRLALVHTVGLLATSLFTSLLYVQFL